MRLSDRLDRWQRRRPWLAYPVAVVYKYVDDQGNFLAALITYYGFLSLFPLLLLLASGLGFVFQRQPRVQDWILDSALNQFPVIGTELQGPAGLQGSGTAVVVGAVIAVYGALRVAQVIQHAMDVCWAVPRNRRPNPVLVRLRSAVIIGLGGVALIVTTVLAALAGREEIFGVALGPLASMAGVVAIVVANSALFLVGMRYATVQAVSARQALPGAVVTAIGWQLLQSFGAAYVSGLVQGRDDTYGVFALVLGLLAWIFLASCLLVLAVEINVVRTRRLYPRALFTPFTDDVDLTAGDKATYTGIASATKVKEFEAVEVTFDDDPDEEAAAEIQPS